MVALVLGSVQVWASSIGPTTEYYTSYDVTLNSGDGITDVTNIILQETQNGQSWPFSTSCGGLGGCSTTINNPFGSTNVPTTALLFGLTNDDQDVVLMTNTTFGASAVGADWNSLFPDTSESSLLTAIELSTSGGPFCPGVNCINPTGLGLNAVSDFGSGDGAGAYFTIGDSFDVLEFSDGALIGSGTSSYSAINPTPEPSSLWLFGSGLVGLAGMVRRKIALRT